MSVWIFLLKHKHEASTCLINFHKMIKTQFGKYIKHIRCDNGGEFVSHKMHDFYATEGIVLEKFCPYTPQQNGVVERKHRHLLETAQALRFQGNLPKIYWGSVVISLSCEEDLASSLGIRKARIGYKIYDLEYKKIIVSRDFRFLEHKFPMNCIPNTQRSHEEDEDLFVFADKEVNKHIDQHTPILDQHESILDNPIHNDHNSFSLDEVLHDDDSETMHANDHVNSEDSNTNNQRPTRTRSQPTLQLPPSISHPQSAINHVSSTVHPLNNYVSYDKFSKTHKSFLAAIVTHDE
uniref:Integrase catalytic domain-containing protein n=1 Tax=Lactuca sativa TaxID=4236 RepID=A0A9R1VSD0_LACSA|nr:hypothetical protein LSAT_V11C400204200 [Lactuca sativa]